MSSKQKGSLFFKKVKRREFDICSEYHQVSLRLLWTSDQRRFLVATKTDHKTTAISTSSRANWDIAEIASETSLTNTKDILTKDILIHKCVGKNTLDIKSKFP